MAMQRQTWSVNALATELGIDRRTVARRLDGATVAERGSRGEPRYRLRDALAAFEPRHHAPAAATVGPLGKRQELALVLPFGIEGPMPTEPAAKLCRCTAGRGPTSRSSCPGGYRTRAPAAPIRCAGGGLRSRTRPVSSGSWRTPSTSTWTRASRASSRACAGPRRFASRASSRRAAQAHHGAGACSGRGGRRDGEGAARYAPGGGREGRQGSESQEQRSC